MSEKKTIQINPELFTFTNNTRKKRPKQDDENKPIKMKTNINNKTTKGKILRYIREQQEENYKKLFENNNNNISNNNKLESSLKSPLVNSSNEVENSIAYLKSISEQQEKKNEMKNQIHNATIKRPPIINTSSQNMFKYSDLNTKINDIEHMNVVNHIKYDSNNSFHLKEKIPILPQPKYGCLKNGNLPTYRTMLQQTRRNYPPILNNNNNNNNTQPLINTNFTNKIHTNPMISIQTNDNNSNKDQFYKGPNNSMNNMNHSVNNRYNQQNQYNIAIRDEQLKKISELKQMKQLLNDKQKTPSIFPKGGKQKKTIRRTYKVGKSKNAPKVSVLISNKTIRKNITMKTKLLKQVPMNEIKKYLISNGFIKIGTIAPNDVLRQMYESAILIGGEIQNHNPDNLLYNYLHNS